MAARVRSAAARHGGRYVRLPRLRRSRSKQRPGEWRRLSRKAGCLRRLDHGFRLKSHRTRSSRSVGRCDPDDARREHLPKQVEIADAVAELSRTEGDRYYDGRPGTFAGQTRGVPAHDPSSKRESPRLDRAPVGAGRRNSRPRAGSPLNASGQQFTIGDVAECVTSTPRRKTVTSHLERLARPDLRPLVASRRAASGHPSERPDLDRRPIAVATSLSRYRRWETAEVLFRPSFEVCA